jgi:hypothetical protein
MKKIVFITLFAICGIAMLSSLASASPVIKNRPGLIRIISDKLQTNIISLEPEGDSKFVILADLPLTLISETLSVSSNAQITRIACSNPDPSPNCLLEIDDGGKRRVARIVREDGNWSIAQLGGAFIPQIKQIDFFHSQRLFYGRSSPISFTSLSANGSVIELHVLDGVSAFKKPVVNRYPIPRPVEASSSIRAFFLLFREAGSQTYRDENDASEWVVADASGQFQSLRPEPHCRALGVVDDKLLCAFTGKAQPRKAKLLSNSDGISIWEKKRPDINILFLSAAETGSMDIMRDKLEPAYFVHYPLVYFPMSRNGLQRPFVLNLKTGKGDWFIPLKCDQATLKNSHLELSGITHNGAPYVTRYGPLEPTRETIVSNDFMKRADCDLAGRTLTSWGAPMDSSAFEIIRATSIVNEIPHTLIKPKKSGDLSGRLMIFSYGVYGLLLYEKSLHLWKEAWLDRGGAIAFAHLPGGGGYGSDWIKAGVGIDGKLNASAKLVSLARFLVSQGHAEHGKVTLYAESGGGAVAGHAGAMSDGLISAVVLRAACLELVSGSKQSAGRACAASKEFGDADNPDDLKKMQAFDPLSLAKARKSKTKFLFIVPEFDDRIDRPYQILMAEKSKPENWLWTVNVPGVNHTQLMDDDREKALVQIVSEKLLSAVN